MPAQSAFSMLRLSLIGGSLSSCKRGREDDPHIWKPTAPPGEKDHKPLSLVLPPHGDT